MNNGLSGSFYPFNIYKKTGDWTAPVFFCGISLAGF